MFCFELDFDYMIREFVKRAKESGEPFAVGGLIERLSRVPNGPGRIPNMSVSEETNEGKSVKKSWNKSGEKISNTQRDVFAGIRDGIKQ